MGGPVDLVQLTAVPGVDFLLAGEPLSSSTELLSGPRFPELLEGSKNYDLILIDGAPVSTLMDGALLAPHVEGVLFCLRAGRPPPTHPLNSLPEMQLDNGNVVGLAMTFVPDDRAAAPRISAPKPLQLQRPVSAGHA